MYNSHLCLMTTADSVLSSSCCLFWPTFGIQIRNENWATLGYFFARGWRDDLRKIRQPSVYDFTKDTEAVCSGRHVGGRV